jgi:hypothetical protein
MSVIFTVIILSVGDSVSVDSEMLLVTDFVSLKIKPTQSFGCAHKNKVCARIFIELSIHMFISICVYSVLKKVIQIILLSRSIPCSAPHTSQAPS